MSTVNIYSLNDAAEALGEDRNLVTYLTRDRQIPVMVVGRTKVLDADGFELLKAAVAEYRSKPDPVPPARRRKARRKDRAAARP